MQMQGDPQRRFILLDHRLEEGETRATLVHRTCDSFWVNSNGVNDSKVNVANGSSNDKSKVGTADVGKLDGRADRVNMVSPKSQNERADRALAPSGFRTEANRRTIAGDG